MPDAILHLGGDPRRIERTIEEARRHPQAVVVISSEGPVNAADIAPERVIVDDIAYDTVGNFTDTWPIIRRLAARRVYVVTSNWHMPRAMAIATVAYFGRGVTPIACPWPNGDHQDPGNVLWDVMRTVQWRVTGRPTSRGYRP